MNVAIGVGGLILIATITPGPNNLVVLQLAGARGIRSTLPAIAGVVSGGLLLIVLAQLGIGAVMSSYPRLDNLLVAAGVMYLGWLGLQLVYRSFAKAEVRSESAPVTPLGAAALFLLQFANPKAWVLVLTVCAAARGADAARWVVPLLFAVISSASLLAWTVLGNAAERILKSELARARFDRVMGALLIGSAGALAVGV